MSAARRARRTREDLRALLLKSALVEFGEKGFEGASTRSIAERVDAHQPQINYHFESKDALWVAAVDHLFTEMAKAIGDLPAADGDDAPIDIAIDLADSIRRFVRFAARHPELNRIMVHEATADSDRLRWMVDTHIRAFYEQVVAIWERLLDAGIAAPIHSAAIHYVVVGAASLPFVNAPEARMLSGIDPTDARFVELHAEGIVAMLLPGLPVDKTLP